jgi:hypothetical protein
LRAAGGQHPLASVNARISLSCPLLVALFFVAHELVALDRGNDAYRTFVSRFGALYASETPDSHWTSQRNFVWKRQENFNGRALFYVFLQEEIDTAGADVAGFCTGFTDGRTSGPSYGERKAHGKALGSAAF